MGSLMLSPSLSPHLPLEGNLGGGVRGADGGWLLRLVLEEAIRASTQENP